jgi:hypothetical protein
MNTTMLMVMATAMELNMERKTHMLQSDLTRPRLDVPSRQQWLYNLQRIFLNNLYTMVIC